MCVFISSNFVYKEIICHVIYNHIFILDFFLYICTFKNIFFHVYIAMFILQVNLNRKNYHYEASTSYRRHDGHGIYRILLSGTCWSGLGTSAARPSLFLAAETHEAAK